MYVDDFTESSALQFVSLLNLTNITQHVSFPTHRLNHTLDHIATSADSTLRPVVSQYPISFRSLSYTLLLFHLLLLFLFFISIFVIFAIIRRHTFHCPVSVFLDNVQCLGMSIN
jgi:predicted ferric reductase